MKRLKRDAPQMDAFLAAKVMCLSLDASSRPVDALNLLLVSRSVNHVLRASGEFWRGAYLALWSRNVLLALEPGVDGSHLCKEFFVNQRGRIEVNGADEHAVEPPPNTTQQWKDLVFSHALLRRLHTTLSKSELLADETRTMRELGYFELSPVCIVAEHGIERAFHDAAAGFSMYEEEWEERAQEGELAEGLPVARWIKGIGMVEEDEWEEVDWTLEETQRLQRKLHGDLESLGQVLCAIGAGPNCDMLMDVVYTVRGDAYACVFVWKSW